MEEQAEEYEVLDSIYGSGDECYKAISSTVFQYKFGDDGSIGSFLLEIRWPETYPVEVPTFNLDAFYNQHLSPTQKSAILKLIRDESENHKGEVQTYTIVEWVRDCHEKLIDVIKLTASLNDSHTISISQPGDEDDDNEKKNPGTGGGTSTKVNKKEQLTKSQKRKEWDRVDAKGERPRGHDWIDVIKHLSQTGGSH